jgi:L,D-peptidoglycan transpeptidase YkuD (ErfK/YbiS/YcfS/YnhG family)
MRAAVLTFALLLAPCAAQAQSCPAPLRDARRLVLVLAPTLSSSIARVQRFERASPDKPWRAIGGPVSALIGYRGVAWAHAFRNLARKGEPIKIDGDKRAPAGFFRIGRSFGFSPSHLPHYLRIAAGTVCVADPRSPAYNTISSRAKVGWRVRGENMWRVPDYRRGLLVDYPTDRMDRAGSCIFIHVRQPGRTGTSGCVALPEREVAALQWFTQSGGVLAILPRQALSRFKGCLP